MSSSGPNRSFVLTIAALVFAGVTLFAAPMSSIQAIQVVPLAREGRVMVSFQLSEGFPDDVKAAIKSGLMTTFAYDVEIKRSAAFWSWALWPLWGREVAGIAKFTFIP